MGRQEDSCWRCEAAWNDRSARPSARLVARGGYAARSGGGGQPSAAAVTRGAREVVQARLARPRVAGESGSRAVQGSRRAQVAAVR
jgi:hypothetical protein